MPLALPRYHRTSTLVVLFIALLALCADQAHAQKVTASSETQRLKAHAGDQFALAVVLDFAEGWHVWPNQPVLPKGYEDLQATPTEVILGKTPALPAGVTLYLPFAQFPKAHEEIVTGVKVLAYSGKAVIYIPIAISPTAKPGKVTIPLSVSYQACNDVSCEQPSTDPVPVEFEIVPADVAIVEGSASTFGDFAPDVFARIHSGTSPTGHPSAPKGIVIDFLGSNFEVGRLAIFLICFVAGLLMNFTPCVLPVIPIKILSLQAQAKEPGKLLLFGTVYCIGIVALFLGIGLLVYTLGLSFGQWFSYWWVTTPLAIFIAAMALGMMGLFTIQLPQSVYMLNPSHDTLAGNFGMGVLTGVLSTPCTGPMFGAAFAWAASEPPAVGLTAICTMGLGMASPYAVLMLAPGLLKKMPRGGPGGELLKQVMGLFMLAVAAYLFTNVIVARWPFWIVGAIAGFACLWWLVGSWRMLRSSTGKVINTLVAVAVLVLVGLATPALAREEPEGGSSAQGWTVMALETDATIRAAIAEGTNAGRPVIVDFTAKWCTNCLVIEKTILNTDQARALFDRTRALKLKVDLTKSGPDQGWGLVKDISGGGGIPLIVIFGPGLDKPIYFQSFFPISALEEALVKAAGK